MFTERGIKPDPKKVESIKEWPVPTNVKDRGLPLNISQVFETLYEYHMSLKGEFTSALKQLEYGSVPRCNNA